jgi:uncharacterized membrane protein YeaQ/YmgE (transglycosylase-associated protein family)
MFNVIGMLIVGLVTGWLARWFYPGSVPIGFWMTILLGVAGSYAGGFLVRLVNKPDEAHRLHRAGMVMSVIGSILLLFIARRLGWW